MTNCKHDTPQWHLADCNEDGWRCAECEHAFGFRPDFDREHTLDKVDAILFWLVEHDFLYVSNASEGSGIVADVASECHGSNTFDQQSIVHMITRRGLSGHAEFWRKEADQAMCAHPARTLRGGAAVCDACGHEVKQVEPGPLFAAKEPF